MKKEEFEAILSHGGVTPDLGPIEDHIHALATERTLPKFAIANCVVRIEESAPALRGVLVKAAEGQTLSDDEASLLFRGLYVLGAARDSQAYAPLLRLLRRPADELEDLLGDAITQNMAQIVAGVFDGDVQALLDVVADNSIDEFVRDALLGAATFLTWDGRIERDRMERFLQRFYDERLSADGDITWVAWLNAIALLGMRHLAPLVENAWREQRIPTDVLEFDDFESDLAEAERAPDDINRFKDLHNLGYIDDALEALSWVPEPDVFEDDDDFEGYDDGDESLSPIEWQPQEPVVNPWRHVGRNDPCPCGSGKKAKKCCLARA